MKNIEKQIEIFNHAKSLVKYNPESGEFIWNKREVLNSRDESWNNRNAGKIVNYLVQGYIRIRFKLNNFPKQVYAHRLAWFIINKEIPNGFVDHINRLKIDNRLQNLRVVGYDENNRNLSKSRRNKSGVTGVSFYKKNNTWQAHCCVDSIRKHLGYYPTIKEAEKVVIDYRKLNGFTETHGQ